MVFESILEEAGGMLCGLPPGTVTAVGAVAKASSSSSNTEEHTQVEKRRVASQKKKRQLSKLLYIMLQLQLKKTILSGPNGNVQSSLWRSYCLLTKSTRGVISKQQY